MDCSGCENKIRKALQKLDGVETVEIDMDEQKVTVTGTFSDQLKILKKVRKTGRRAELWPFPHNPVLIYPHTTTIKHGYDGHSHGLYHQLDHLSGLNERATVMFSEDNPHACSIM
ncbi:unnamed protein product [Rhodiola kirilowii]